MKRKIVAVGALAGLGLLNTVPALADDINPPKGAAPVVGMAYLPSTGSLWLAGPRADEGVLVNAADGSTVSFNGKPKSVQAVASFSNRLWVGDIGDKDASRESITVFRLGSVEGERSAYQSYAFSYEDGAHHAQAMAISGRGRIYIVTSGSGAAVYRAELEPSRQRVNKLTRVADAPEGVTDAVFLSDGSTLALRCKEGVVYLDAWNWERLLTQTLIGAPDGESIAVNKEDALFVGGNSRIRQTYVPSSNETIKVSEPSTSPSGSPTPSPSASAAQEDSVKDDEGAPPMSGTLIALSLAGVVALAAGVITLVSRR